MKWNEWFFFDDKQDFLDDGCLTPDCGGSVVNIQIFDTDGLKTEVITWLKHFRPYTKFWQDHLSL